jgi:glyoxylase-like metal-dependent hydrolase (beta-lactamase superfamily II)
MIPMNYKLFCRECLPGPIAALAAIVLGALPQVGVSAEGELALTPVTERVSMISGAGGNVVVLETAEGLALVDSGTAAKADELLEFIDETFDGAPVRVLFNTHWRPDHTGANEALARSGATIIAHENTRLWMATEYYVEWEEKNYPPRPDAALPTSTFYASDPQPLIYELGDYRIEYGHLAEAHTDGDIYVRFVADDVIAVGDVLAIGTFPTLDYSTGGWIGGAQSATELLLEITGPQTRIVAGEGPVQARAALESQRVMLDELRERIRVRIIQGKSIEEILAENVTEGYEALGSPRRFVSNVYNGLWWGGRLRGAY